MYVYVFSLRPKIRFYPTDGCEKTARVRIFCERSSLINPPRLEIARDFFRRRNTWKKTGVQFYPFDKNRRERSYGMETKKSKRIFVSKWKIEMQLRYRFDTSAYNCWIDIETISLIAFDRDQSLHTCMWDRLYYALNVNIYFCFSKTIGWLYEWFRVKKLEVIAAIILYELSMNIYRFNEIQIKFSRKYCR